MNRTGLWIRTGVIVAIMLIGVYLVFGPRRTPTGTDFTWTGIKNNLANNINLGLDLKGGSHLVMRVKTEEYLKRLTQNDEAAAQGHETIGRERGHNHADGMESINQPTQRGAAQHGRPGRQRWPKRRQAPRFWVLPAHFRPRVAWSHKVFS